MWGATGAYRDRDRVGERLGLYDLAACRGRGRVGGRRRLVAWAVA